MCKEYGMYNDLLANRSVITICIQHGHQIGIRSGIIHDECSSMNNVNVIHDSVVTHMMMVGRRDRRDKDSLNAAQMGANMHESAKSNLAKVDKIFPLLTVLLFI